MWAALIKFVWNHFWKMATAASWLAFVWFVDSIQQPAKVQARIVDIENYQTFLRDEQLKLEIKVGTNDLLFQKVDNKMDTLNTSLIILTQRVGQLINKP